MNGLIEVWCRGVGVLTPYGGSSLGPRGDGDLKRFLDNMAELALTYLYSPGQVGESVLVLSTNNIQARVFLCEISPNQTSVRRMRRDFRPIRQRYWLTVFLSSTATFKCDWTLSCHSNWLASWLVARVVILWTRFDTVQTWSGWCNLPLHFRATATHQDIASDYIKPVYGHVVSFTIYISQRKWRKTIWND